MNDELVNRLRLWAENMHGQKSSVIAVVMAKAADEIERLRVVVQGWEHSSRNAERDIETLRAERDEARRMWCELMAANTAAHREQVANRHGWDCFKEVKP